MKIILDMDDEALKNMQGYCDVQNIEMSNLIEKLFNKYVQEPANTIDEVYSEKGNLKDLEGFQKILIEYMNEAIYDIESASKSDEAYETDERMVEVFKALSRDYLHESYILTGLYKVFKEGD